MDNITLIKQLIAALQALVAIYSAQLAALNAPVAPVSPLSPPAVAYTQPMPTQSIGAPDLNSVVTPPISPTCSLTVKASLPDTDPRTGQYDWTSTGLDDSVTGQLFYGTQFGIGNGETEFRWVPIGSPVSGASGQYILSYQSISGAGPMFSPLDVNGEQLKLVLGGTTCTYTWFPQ